MKKILSLILALLILSTAALTLSSCGKVTCPLCDDEVFALSTKKTEIFGQEVKICKDCYNGLNKLGKEIEEGLEDLFG